MDASTAQSLIISDHDGIRSILLSVQRIAVVGIKPESHSHLPSFYVPQYLSFQGLEVIPVPVYFPLETTILGQKVYRDLRDIPAPIDLVNIFRRSEDVPSHLQQILAVKPRIVWMQSGISHSDVAWTLASNGIYVVQDRCLMVDFERLVKPRRDET